MPVSSMKQKIQVGLLHSDDNNRGRTIINVNGYFAFSERKTKYSLIRGYCSSSIINIGETLPNHFIDDDDDDDDKYHTL